MSRSPPHPSPLPSRPSQAATKAVLTLLPQLGLSLLDRRNNHVTDTGVGETVQVRASAVRLDNEERLGAAVVGAVEDGTGGETHGHPELVARGTCACLSYVSLKQMEGQSGKSGLMIHIIKR